ncbi:MAG: 16S rRNA (adenine(1518)-N(6)/adenine(1519)-N(6))-dimethyltransferase RsmA [Candidatus Buchananbacteria bacterium]
MNLTKIKEVCAKAGIVPSKILGQNFLVDENVVNKIISEANIENTETILEVGPGVGVLTGEILKRAQKVIAVELDIKVLNFLRAEFFNEKNLQLVEKNILKANRLELGFENFRYKIISNLPYNITSKFLRLFLEQEPRPYEMILMVQKEVAQRIVAKVGEMSLLSLSCQFYAEPELLFIVNKKSFWPEPKIDSAVIRLKLKENVDKNQAEGMFRVARMGFSSRRKQLHNNLSAGLKITSEEAKTVIKSLGFDEKIRAQDLSVKNWIGLAEALKH